MVWTNCAFPTLHTGLAITVSSEISPYTARGPGTDLQNFNNFTWAGFAGSKIIHQKCVKCNKTKFETKQRKDERKIRHYKHIATKRVFSGKNDMQTKIKVHKFIL